MTCSSLFYDSMIFYDFYNMLDGHGCIFDFQAEVTTDSQLTSSSKGRHWSCFDRTSMTHNTATNLSGLVRSSLGSRAFRSSTFELPWPVTSHEQPQDDHSRAYPVCLSDELAGYVYILSVIVSSPKIQERNRVPHPQLTWFVMGWFACHATQREGWVELTCGKLCAVLWGSYKTSGMFVSEQNLRQNQLLDWIENDQAEDL